MGNPDGELVSIFADEESDLTNDIQEQRDSASAGPIQL